MSHYRVPNSPFSINSNHPKLISTLYPSHISNLSIAYSNCSILFTLPFEHTSSLILNKPIQYNCSSFFSRLYHGAELPEETNPARNQRMNQVNQPWDMRDCMWNGNCWQWHRLGIRKVDLVKVEACWIWERLKMISDCLRIRGNGFDDVQRNEMRTRGKGWKL